jgi:predicted small secreted protein
MDSMKRKLIIGMLLICSVAISGCSSLQRAGKNIASDFGGGLERKLTVYNQSGQPIKEYQGKFDVQANEYGNKVLFDMNGKRIIIYNATVIVEEE